jgi:hypothetical protein
MPRRPSVVVCYFEEMLVPSSVVWRLGGPSSRGKIASCSPGGRRSNARLESLAGAHRRAQIQRLCDGQKGDNLDIHNSYTTHTQLINEYCHHYYYYYYYS